MSRTRERPDLDGVGNETPCTRPPLELVPLRPREVALTAQLVGVVDHLGVSGAVRAGGDGIATDYTPILCSHLHGPPPLARHRLIMRQYMGVAQEETSDTIRLTRDVHRAYR